MVQMKDGALLLNTANDTNTRLGDSKALKVLGASSSFYALRDLSVFKVFKQKMPE